jgi:hypothetical protein
MLRVLEGWKAFGHYKSQIADFITRCERISKQLYGWIENLKDSDIAGQRRFTEKERQRYAGKKEREEFLSELQRLTDRKGKEEPPK